MSLHERVMRPSRHSVPLGIAVAAILSAATLSACSSSDNRSNVASLRANWVASLEHGARADPGSRYDNLAPSTVRTGLRALGGTFGFQVVSVRFLRPRQLAPQIILRWPDIKSSSALLSHVIPAIDPYGGTDGRFGWFFEGIFVELVDRLGSPYLAVWNHWRNDRAGGGQWARSQGLLPAPHG
jgi:hypothetical protein